MQCKCQGSCQAYYGSHEEAPILPKQSVPMKKHSEGSHGPNKESQLLLHLGREIVLADGTEAQSAASKGSGFLDELFQEVHSNESTTTVTIDSDVDDCEKYHKSNILQRGAHFLLVGICRSFFADTFLSFSYTLQHSQSACSPCSSRSFLRYPFFS